MCGLEGITFHEGNGLAQLPGNVFGRLDDLDLQDDDDPPGNKPPTSFYYHRHVKTLKDNCPLQRTCVARPTT